MKKNTNLKKRDKLVLTIIIVSIVIAIILYVIVTLNGKDNAQNGNLKGTEEEKVFLDGQIDYTNEENVNIKDNVKENNSKALLKEKEFEGMKVKNIKLIANNVTTKFTATVENTSTINFKNQK